MKKVKLLVSTLSILFALPVLAAEAPTHTITGNVSLVSDYVFRGISQTNGKPAIQGGFDYGHSSGFYAGVWGSSISWLTDTPATTGVTNSQLELDTYFGFKSSAGELGYDIGFLRYNYPASYVATLPAGSAKADTDEIYGSLGYKFVTAKFSYSLGNTFGIDKSKGSNYIDLSANYPIADTGIMIGAHVGKQTYKGTVADGLAAANSSATYTDYKLTVSKDIGGFAVGLAYSSTNANKTQYTNSLNKYLGRDTVVLSVSRSF